MTNEMTTNQLFKELNDNVIAWADTRGIFAKAGPKDQIKKTIEEVQELYDGIQKGDAYEIIDGIGDVMVTLIILAEMCDLDVVSCLAAAYDEIKDRKGKMVDGLFVKETNTTEV